MNADTLLHWLLRTSLEASLLIFAVLGLRLMLGTRLSPAWRIGLWMLVGAKLMLPAFIPAGFGLGGWMKSESGHATSQNVVISAPEPSVLRPDSIEEPALPTLQSSSFDIRYFALVLWVTGAAWVLLTALLRQHRFNLALKRRPRATAPLLRALVASLSHQAGVHKALRVVLMPAGTTPAVVGIARPSILIPEDWETRFDESSLRHVLLHELLHVKQHDLIWNWAATAVQALHWFNPLVWFVVSRFQADRELRCDAGALALLSPTERLDYGHTLLRIQETFFAPPAMTGLAPCVRNHPTLRQRIHMIAHPTTRQPVLQLLLVLTLSVLVCYSFTTARAQEKEVPPKERTREGSRKEIVPGDNGSDGVKKTGDREREGDGAARKPGVGDKDGERKPGMKEGDGGTKKPGMRDGDGGAKKPGTGDGEGARKPGMRDGDGGTKKPGTGDGEGARKSGMRDGEKPRTGERDGEKPRTGARDGEGPGKTGTRDGEGAAKVRKGDNAAATSSEETITLRVIKKGEAVLVGDKEIAMNNLRGHLSTFLPEHPGARIIVISEVDVPFRAIHNTADAVRDNGNKNVGIPAQ